MIIKNNSKIKLSLALISLVITFFVWQQGLKDSLNRPSVSFDISQKEQEITVLAAQSIPSNLKKFFTVGLAFSFQEIKKIPINKFDQKLDIILTDKKIIK